MATGRMPTRHTQYAHPTLVLNATVAAADVVVTLKGLSVVPGNAGYDWETRATV